MRCMRLVILSGSLTGRQFEPSSNGLVIGRRPECDVRFGEADNLVSGLHARISWRDGVWTIKDEGSRNGTLLDGQPVTETPLANGQLLAFGRGGPTARVELPPPVARRISAQANQSSGLISVYHLARERV